MSWLDGRGPLVYWVALACRLHVPGARRLAVYLCTKELHATTISEVLCRFARDYKPTALEAEYILRWLVEMHDYRTG